MRFAIICFLSLFIFSEPQWGSDLEKAKQQARENNKLVLLYFSGSDWCGPCIKLKKDVLDTDDFLAFASEKLVLLRADFPRAKKNQLDKIQIQKNEKMAELYNSAGKFPYTVLLNSEGKILKEWDGYPKELNAKLLQTQIQVFL